MGLKKGFFLSVILLMVLVGFFGVVSAEITGVDITSPISGNYINGIKTITWSLIGTDEAGDRYNVDYSSEGVVWISINSQPLAPGSTSINWNTDSLNGNYEIRVQQYNNGLKNQDIVTGIIVDNIKPTAVISDVSASWTNSDSITLGCSDTSGCLTTRWYYFDGDGVCSSSKSDYTNSVSGETLTVSATHSDYLCLWVEDNAGNSQYTPAGSLLYIDAINPTANLIITPTGLTNQNTITYTPTCSDSGGSGLASCTTYVKFNGGLPTSISITQAAGQTYTMTNDGTYTFYTVAVDNAGNNVPTSNYDVQRDMAAPVISITNAPTTTWNVGSSVNVEKSCDDSNAQIKYYYSDTTLDCSTKSFDSDYVINNAATKPYVCAAAKDIAGNIGYSSVAQFKISPTIQGAINQANSGDTINVAAGTYSETLNLQGKTLTINGAGIGSTIVDAHSFMGYAIQNFGSSSVIKDLKLIGTGSSSSSYGFKISGVSGITLENIKVENSYKTGIDLNTVTGAILNNIEVTGTVSGFGLMILDSNAVTVTDITTSGNAWGGVSVQTKNAVSNNIVFNGNFNVTENFPLLLEKDPTGYYEITNVPIPSKFQYVVYDFRAPNNYKQWYYFETLDVAKTTAQNFAASTNPLYSNILIYNIAKDNYYVEPGMKIQDAVVDATTGDTINVAAGTYNENQIVINKNLNIIGEDKNSVIITPTSNTAMPLGGTSPPGDSSGFILIQDGITADISGITIDGTGKNIGVGILSYGSGTINNNIIKNIKYSQYRGFGVYLWNSDMTVSNNEFTNIERVDALMKGSSTNGMITNNIFNCKGNGDWLDYAVELGASAQGTISDNVISNCRGVAAVDGSTSAGILVTTYYGAGTQATITGNTITDSYDGIAVGYDGLDTSSVTANYNKFIGITNYGIDSTAPAVNATFNWWGDLDPSNNVNANVNYIPFAEDDTLTRFYVPILNAIGDKTVNEGSPLTITLSATDADVSDTLIFSDNAVFGSLIGNTFTWTPTGTDQGSNTIAFSVSDGDLIDSETIIITVNNVAPVVNAGVDQTVNEGVLVSFSGSATDAGNDALTYNWNFGDSNTGTGQSTTHIYEDNGVYTVTLSVNDGTTTITDALTVTVNNVAPTITTATANKVEIVVGESISFTGTATDVSADTLTYLWNFGDNQTSALQNPTHSYTSKGTYTVTLTVDDGDGGSDTEIITITVNDLIWDLSSASGWNLVSAPKNLTDNSMPANDVWGYNIATGWTRPTTITPGVGYWINNAPTISKGLNYAGDCTGPQCLPSGKINIDALQNSWNLIGLTSTEAMNVSSAFSSTIFSQTNLPVYYVIKYTESTDSFSFMSAGDIMNSGEGYWVYVVK